VSMRSVMEVLREWLHGLDRGGGRRGDAVPDGTRPPLRGEVEAFYGAEDALFQSQAAR